MCLRKNFFILFALTTSVLLSSCGNQKQIDEMNKKIDNLTNDMNIKVESLSAEVKNQTSLFYETVGKVLPVVVPEEDEKKFEELQKSVKKLSENINQENLTESVNLYMDFIQKTAPWIQQKLSKDLLTVKYDIDYYSIRNTYQTDNDLEKVIDSLQSFVVANADYENLKSVIEYYNKLVDKQNEEYKSNLENFKSKLAQSISNKEISYNELIALLKEIESYSDEDSLQNEIEKLNQLTEDAALKNQLEREISILSDEIKNYNNEVLELDSYSIFTDELAGILYRVNTIKTLNVTSLNNNIDEVSKLLGEYEEKIKRKQEAEYVTQITNSLAEYKKEIDNLKADITFNYAVSIFVTSLEQIKSDVIKLKYSDKLTLMKNVDECFDKLRAKEKAVIAQSERDAKAENEKNLAKQKRYNINTLNLITSVKNEADKIKDGFLDDKAKATMQREQLLLELEKVQQGYITSVPVSFLYNEVYSELWGKLDNSAKAEVSKIAVTYSKWELGDEF